ncbi:TetR/AcrR family transcriptional regulator [Mycobacterium sp. WMMD1722]|uniref:TetR/AcrR family transcriptional regulator n=1 Tax=Mycobacterium sp. WMMD1722 TaxID=3404117 RepID=UPI003BF60222
MSRVEAAAATRRALLDEAAHLLDDGGPDAVTLREVGARAGVTRGAPYRHFADKDSLLTTVAAEGWERLSANMSALHDGSNITPAEKLQAALSDVVTLSRQRPRLYQLMFTPPAGDSTALTQAVQRTCDQFLTIVTDVVGAADAQRYAAILLTGTHGAAALEMSGLLTTAKWHTTAEELTASIIAVIHQTSGGVQKG